MISYKTIKLSNVSDFIGGEIEIAKNMTQLYGLAANHFCGAEIESSEKVKLIKNFLNGKDFYGNQLAGNEGTFHNLILDKIIKHGSDNGLDHKLILSVIAQESSFTVDPSTNTDYCGLMQVSDSVISETISEYNSAQEARDAYVNGTIEEKIDISLRSGIKYLANKIKSNFPSNIWMAITSYNAGTYGCNLAVKNATILNSNNQSSEFKNAEFCMRWATYIDEVSKWLEEGQQTGSAKQREIGKYAMSVMMTYTKLEGLNLKNLTLLDNDGPLSLPATLEGLSMANESAASPIPKREMTEQEAMEAYQLATNIIKQKTGQNTQQQQQTKTNPNYGKNKTGYTAPAKVKVTTSGGRVH